MLNITHNTYEEHQHFRQWWVWIILVLVELLCVTGVVVQIFMGQDVGTEPVPIWIMILYALFILALLFMFYRLRLDIIIDRTGIRYRWYPFQGNGRYIQWSEIESTEVRKYKPIREYGGWGVRFGITRRGSAHNVSGNMGLQLVLKNRKHILLGTQHPEKLREFLNDREQSVEGSPLE